MKIIILFSLFISQAHAIELVLNGVSYNIDEYKISKNGQKIVISDRRIPPQKRIRRAKVRRVPSSVKTNPFQSLLRELRSTGNQNSNFK